jgi:hypothetical protein
MNDSMTTVQLEQITSLMNTLANIQTRLARAKKLLAVSC